MRPCAHGEISLCVSIPAFIGAVLMSALVHAHSEPSAQRSLGITDTLRVSQLSTLQIIQSRKPVRTPVFHTTRIPYFDGARIGKLAGPALASTNDIQTWKGCEAPVRTQKARNGRGKRRVRSVSLPTPYPSRPCIRQHHICTPLRL